MKIKVFLMLSAITCSAGLFAQKDINITIDGSADLARMQKVKMELMENEYNYNVTKMEFGTDGKLKHLSFRITSPDGHRATVTKDFNSATDRVRIIRNHKGTPEFCAGEDC